MSRSRMTEKNARAGWAGRALSQRTTILTGLAILAALVSVLTAGGLLSRLVFQVLGL